MQCKGVLNPAQIWSVIYFLYCFCADSTRVPSLCVNWGYILNVGVLCWSCDTRSFGIQSIVLLNRNILDSFINRIFPLIFHFWCDKSAIHTISNGLRSLWSILAGTFIYDFYVIVIVIMNMHRRNFLSLNVNWSWIHMLRLVNLYPNLRLIFRLHYQIVTWMNLLVNLWSHLLLSCHYSNFLN